MKKKLISCFIVAGFAITMCVTNGHTTDSSIESNLMVTEADAVTSNESPANAQVMTLVSGSDVTPSGSEEEHKMESDSKSDTESELESEEDEYASLAIAADVSNYVNIRSLPSTDGEIVGKIYQGAVAEILDEEEALDGLWFHITSGSVDGYIKAEYFVYGSEAADRIDEYVTRAVKINADRLNVRSEADQSASKIGYLDYNEKATMLEDCGDWIKVQYSPDKIGYVSSEYVTIMEEFTYAKSIEEEQAELAAIEEQKQREAELAAEEQARQEAILTASMNADGGEVSSDAATTVAEIAVTEPAEEITTNSYSNAVANTSYSTNDELRSSIVNYAMQYLGNVYIHGGQSLETGTDCSGFTSLIYAVYGYSLSRTPGGQLSNAGRSISIEEAKPGDVVCYSSNGGKSCTHVALYIGNGQIIHSANSRKGVIISDVYYSTIVCVKNVID